MPRLDDTLLADFFAGLGTFGLLDFAMRLSFCWRRHATQLRQLHATQIISRVRYGAS